MYKVIFKSYKSKKLIKGKKLLNRGQEKYIVNRKK